jgi:hypothetical protein
VEKKEREEGGREEERVLGGEGKQHSRSLLLLLLLLLRRRRRRLPLERSRQFAKYEEREGGRWRRRGGEIGGPLPTTWEEREERRENRR